MFGYFILAFFLYFIYRFVTGFVLPIWKSTKTVRQNVRNMQQNQSARHTQATASSEEKIKTFTEKAGDYIDFEEVEDSK